MSGVITTLGIPEIRIVFKEKSYVRNETIYKGLNWTTMMTTIKDRARRVFNQLEMHPNSYLRGLADYDVRLINHFKRP